MQISNASGRSTASSRSLGPGTSFFAFLTNFPIFVLEASALAIIFTWVFNHTRVSLFIAILLHASIDATSGLIPLFSAPIVTSTDLSALIGFGVPAQLIVILTRGRLGYQSGQEQPVRQGGIETQLTP